MKCTFSASKLESQRFLAPGEKSYGEPPALLEDIKQVSAKERIRGKLIVYVVSVMDVIPEDGDTCDPLVEITFNNKTLATPNAVKTVNAEFKKKLEFPADFESIDVVLA